MTIEEINKTDDELIIEQFMMCCGSTNWAQAMADARPFDSAEDLHTTAVAIWQGLEDSDWLEAFTHHPKIGDIENLRKKFASTAEWAEGEQSGAAQASEAVLKKLADLNKVYEKKYGYIFIVCATGKTAEEMLALLENRLDNPKEKELKIAVGEQQKITTIRLNKLLA